MTDLTLLHDDCKVALRRLIDEGVRVHSIVTDPPYGLVSIQKRFGNGQAAAKTDGNDGSFARLSGGFMNQKWDGSGIELDVELWELCREILLPGGYLLAFSSPRTGHRMACAIEDAGFIIHPFIGWAYGSGFPKATAADKQIDKHLGARGEVAPSGDPVRRIRPGADQNKDGSWEKLEDRQYQPGEYVPATPEAAQWQGYAYGGQARKPALEPIYVAQKPFSEKNGAANILKHGVGAVNIDGCRVPAPGEVITNHSRSAESAVSKGKYGDSREQETHQTAGQALGRYPANLIHDGSPEVVDQFPTTKSGTGAVKRKSSADRDGNTGSAYGAESRSEGTEMVSYGDEGSAARFFECYPFEDQTIFYNAKAGKADRAGSKHPTVKPIALMRSLVRHVTPPGGTVLDPFAGTGTTGLAAQEEGFASILIEAHGPYVDDIRRRFGIGEDAMRLYLDVLGLVD